MFNLDLSWKFPIISVMASYQLFSSQRHISLILSFTIILILIVTGTCLDLSGGFNCSCVAGWVGDLCQTNFDDCSSNPCYENQTCVDDIDDFHCLCPQGKLLFIFHKSDIAI